MPQLHRPVPVKAGEESPPEETKAQLQQEMDQARESIGQTVEQIKGTVEDQIDSVKDTVGGVLALREGFKNEPVVWSLGALSAGFALGYTLGYANKRTKTKGSLPTPLAAFVDDLARELSKVGNDLVLPSLNTHIKTTLGFDLVTVLNEMGAKPKRVARAPAKGRVRRAKSRITKRPPRRRTPKRR